MPSDAQRARESFASRPPAVRFGSESRLLCVRVGPPLLGEQSRFHELVKSGVMPPPCYCIHTRRPLYPREVQELAIDLRMSNRAFDGRYVLYYNRPEPGDSPAAAPRTSRASRQVGPATASDGRVGEVIESLRALRIGQSDSEIRAAVSECYPGGLPDDFEMALTNVFRHLRRLHRSQ